MSYGRGSNGELSETFQNILDGAGRFGLYAGALASGASIGLLVFLCAKYGGGATDNLAMAHNSIDVLSRVLLAGLIVLAVGSTLMFWGAEVLGALQLLLAAGLYFTPLYLPSIFGSNASGNGAEVFQDALAALQNGGIWFGLIAALVVVADIYSRVVDRSRKGVKSDQLKFGKGIKEEVGKKNVFLGKCWQLPFCRQFVRDRCPIYHAKTTCWRELVGCMCEEAVIRNAMENKPIPKDALLAAKMIPHNNRLTDTQKRERCRNCVIYNEHQRHKYKAAMPTVSGVFVLIYILLHGPLIEAVKGMVTHINYVMHSFTAGSAGPVEVPRFFVETLLFVLFLIGLSYAMKTVEYLIFRAKV